MLRVIFDTNIYGFLFLEKDYEMLIKTINKDKEFIVYGYEKVRKEIRDIPKTTTLSKKARIGILKVYDKITGSHLLKNSLKINRLAKKYYDYYKREGGTYGWDTSIRIDFMTVACATIESLDLVYSEDKKTLLNKHALKAYNHINMKENLRTPNFLKYDNLLLKLRNLI